MNIIKKYGVPALTLIAGVVLECWKFSKSIHEEEELQEMVSKEVERQLSNNDDEEESE